jgi:pimeloyl-ACP methyl ester carboxylesterase
VITAGHSLGGAVAVALAARRPDAVRGLVLLSSCEKIPPSDDATERFLAALPGPLRKVLFFSMAKKVLFASGAPADAARRRLNANGFRPLLKDLGPQRSQFVLWFKSA